MPTVVAPNGEGADAVGGQITITAQIDVYGGLVRADGAVPGGGQIRLGGDFHGQGTLPPAHRSQSMRPR